MFQNKSKHYISFKGSHTIIEEEYYCHIKSTDFDVSMNPTLRKNNIKNNNIARPKDK